MSLLINLKELPLTPGTLKEQLNFSFSQTSQVKSSFDAEISNYLV